MQVYLQVRSVSFHFSPARYLRVCFRSLTASRVKSRQENQARPSAESVLQTAIALLSSIMNEEPQVGDATGAHGVPGNRARVVAGAGEDLMSSAGRA